jgi:DNA gyrase subunit B
MNRYAEDNGFLKKNDAPLTSAELSEGLVVVFNLKVNSVKYDSQTKVRVVDVDKTLINNVINNDFVAWLANNPKDAKIIIDKALMARKAKEAAQNAKDRIRNATTKGKKFINLPTKLIDAYSKDRGECELLIAEGDSAANGLIAKRDGKTQAVFPIRGKVLSCRKATSDKVYANQEISNIVKAIGLDIDKNTGKLIYDAKKLRYGKIILAGDGDEDGANIRALLLNMFWWLCPELVMNGHIAVAYPPLFRITTKTNSYIYLKDRY